MAANEQSGRKKIGSKPFRIIMALIVACLLASLFLPVFDQVRVTSPGSTRTMGNARQLALACKLYADDNGGHFPARLHDVAPAYISEENYGKAKFRDFSGADDGAKKYILWIKISDTNSIYFKQPPQEWNYYGGQLTAPKPSDILIAAPVPCTLDENKW